MSKSNLPNFLFTYWNPFDEKKPNISDSLNSYVKDVQLANYTGNVIGKFLQNQTKEQINAINEMCQEVQNIDNSINIGFEQIDQRLAIIKLEQFNSNLLLKDIKKILRQPDREKQRIKHIEYGMKFFNQAIKNEEIITDAIEEFEKALSLMKQDWLSGFQLGICYTYYKKICNLNKAEVLFLNAAKYAEVDTLEGNEFKENFYKTISIQSNNENVLLDFAAECYIQAAFIRYIQGDFKVAVEYALKATNVSKTNPKCYFLLAKYQSRNGNYQEAINNLNKAFQLNKQIYKTFISDIDIVNNPLFKNNYKIVLLEVKKGIENDKKKQRELLDEEDFKIFKEIYSSSINRMFENDLEIYFNLGYYATDDYVKSVINLKLKIKDAYLKSGYKILNNLYRSEFEKENIKGVYYFIKKIFKIETYEDLEKIKNEFYNKNENALERFMKMSKFNEKSVKIGNILIDIYTKESKKNCLGKYCFYFDIQIFLEFFERLKKLKVFDNIEIVGINKRNERICKQYFEYYLNRIDPSRLPSLEEIQKKWWENLF